MITQKPISQGYFVLRPSFYQFVSRGFAVLRSKKAVSAGVPTPYDPRQDFPAEYADHVVNFRPVLQELRGLSGVTRPSEISAELAFRKTLTPPQKALEVSHNYLTRDLQTLLSIRDPIDRKYFLGDVRARFARNVPAEDSNSFEASLSLLKPVEEHVRTTHACRLAYASDFKEKLDSVFQAAFQMIRVPFSEEPVYPHVVRALARSYKDVSCDHLDNILTFAKTSEIYALAVSQPYLWGVLGGALATTAFVSLHKKGAFVEVLETSIECHNSATELSDTLVKDLNSKTVVPDRAFRSFAAKKTTSLVEHYQKHSRSYQIAGGVLALGAVFIPLFGSSYFKT